jgi:hypothetical protein
LRDFAVAKPLRNPFFNCPSCAALYQVISVESGPESTTDQEVSCGVCGGPLAARDGEFVLKYFLLRSASRKKSWQKKRGALQTDNAPR